MTISDIPFGRTAMARRAGYDACSHVHLSSTGESIAASEYGVIVVPIGDVPVLSQAGWVELDPIASMPPSPRPPNGPLATSAGKS